MKKEGGCEWYQSMGPIFLYIPANLEEVKAYRLILLKPPPPLFFHFTVPLKDAYCLSESGKCWFLIYMYLNINIPIGKSYKR
jgi:hypothetical protein